MSDKPQTPEAVAFELYKDVKALLLDATPEKLLSLYAKALCAVKYPEKHPAA